MLIDFWGTACPACIGTITSPRYIEQRAKAQEKGEVEFVYITDTTWSPNVAGYEKFIAENGMTNSYRLSRDEFNILSPLVNLSALPRYVLLDEQGRIFNDDYPGHSLNHEFL